MYTDNVTRNLHFGIGKYQPFKINKNMNTKFQLSVK